MAAVNSWETVELYPHVTNQKTFKPLDKKVQYLQSTCMKSHKHLASSTLRKYRNIIIKSMCGGITIKESQHLVILAAKSVRISVGLGMII